MSTEVGVHVTICSIHDIDMNNETAVVDVDISLFMRGTQSDLEEVFEEIYFVAAISRETDKDSLTSLNFDEILPGIAGAELCLTVKVKFDMDFANFPFDTQDLILTFYQAQYRHKFVSAAKFWKENASCLYSTPLLCVPTALINEEWTLGAPLIHYEKSDPLETMEAFTQVSVSLKFVRKGRAYAFRYIGSMTALSFASILPFVQLPAAEVSDMLAYEVGLLFAIVAFQMLTSSLIPMTTTISILDQYGLFLFFFLMLTMVTITVISWVENSAIDNWNVHACWLFAIWMVYHLYFGIFVVNTIKRQTEMLNSTKKKEFKRNAYMIKGENVQGTIVNKLVQESEFCKKKEEKMMKKVMPELKNVNPVRKIQESDSSKEENNDESESSKEESESSKED